jgi:hypothetical protein
MVYAGCGVPVLVAPVPTTPMVPCPMCPRVHMADEQQQQQARGSTSITCHVCTTASTVATVPVQGPVPVPYGLELDRTIRYSCTRYSLLYHVLCTIEAVCEPMRIYAAAAGCEPRAEPRATRALWGVNRHAGEDGRGARARCDAPDPVSRHLRGRAGQTRWRRATSAAVGGVRSRFAAAVRAGGRCRGVIGADFPGRRPCWTSGRGGGRCDWAVCEVVK